MRKRVILWTTIDSTAEWALIAMVIMGAVACQVAEASRAMIQQMRPPARIQASMT